VELSNFNGIPHLISHVVTDPKKALLPCGWVVHEMENRYEIFAGLGVKDIFRYNQIKREGENTALSPMPFIIVLIDELADLMMVAPADVEDAICRLAQMARAAGIHLVVATQRPSVDVITGVIKANIPSRIAFCVSSQTDSRTILDMGGPNGLLGREHMLSIYRHGQTPAGAGSFRL
jgi:S-DNA-T family DNA segregation ATPase FtsK/SpoIIIE